MSAMYHKNSQRGDERGFASLAVALIMVIVLALIVVGFAQLSRQEQKRALDKQLSMQAYNAAESGVNDTIKYIEAVGINAILDGPPTLDPNKCQKLVPELSIINASNDVRYSCVLLDLALKNLFYKDVGAGQGRTTVFSTRPNTLHNLYISWKNTDWKIGSTFPGSVNSGFQPLDSWNNNHPPTGWPSVLQFSITPLTASFDRNSLVNNQFTAFLYPTSAGMSAVSYSTASNAKGPVARAQCIPATGACTAHITGIPNGSSTPSIVNYMIHFLNFYDTADVTISGTDLGGLPVAFIGGQAQIDVTGKSRDVLKRIQVRVPLDSPGDLPNWAIESKDTCKRQETRPGSTKFINAPPYGSGPTISGPCAGNEL